MNKVCCGITYSESDNFCQVCGRRLNAEEEVIKEEQKIEEPIVKDEKEEDEPETSVLAEEDKPTIIMQQENQPVMNQQMPQMGQPVMNGQMPQMGQPVMNGQMPQMGQPMMNGQMPQMGQPMMNQQMVPQKPPKPPRTAEQKAKTKKICGITSMVIAGLGLVAVGVTLFFYVINPKYKDFEGAAKEGLSTATTVEATITDAGKEE